MTRMEKYKGLAKLCNLISMIAKLDVKLLNPDGKKIIQMAINRLPAGLVNSQDENISVTDLLKNSQENTYMHYINSAKLEYVIVGVWRDEQYRGSIVVGPFLSEYPSDTMISQIISLNKLPISERKQYKDFYESLSILSSQEINSIGELLVNLCPHEYITSTQLITINNEDTKRSVQPIQEQIEDRQMIIEHRYKMEKFILNAIAKGDKEAALQYVSGLTDVHLKNRIPESAIRSTKNLTLVQNTLFRLAAEKGGIHPVYLHDISEKFAILIERADNLPALNKIMVTMFNEYCDLVKEFSTRTYSSIVKNAVNYINFHLGGSLSLNEIAEAVHVNASHLSKKFKVETGQSITDYINMKRIDAAKLYLSNSKMSITDIAYLVGYNDVNYFSRIFKKITSQTPSQYIKGIE